MLQQLDKATQVHELGWFDGQDQANAHEQVEPKKENIKEISWFDSTPLNKGFE